VSSVRKNLLLNKIPNFILFKSFEDDIPNRVSFSELQKNEFIRDLEVISNFDKSILTSGNDRKQSNHKESVNVEFNKEYKEFWTQDNTSFEFDWHDKNLLVWIKENGQRYKPTERSKGKQWHLSFYIRVTARSNESKDNIILIDEPGMYLHAKAQSDIYNKLLKISKKTQIIFTTHSPYLLKYDEIDRIRLVNKSNTNSWINQKVHAGSDKETLTPLLTSIGLELNSEIHSMDKICNVVVEGPSDFYYLQAIKLILDCNDFNFIFGGGSTKMPFVGTILTGWGCYVIYLFDNDQGKNQGEKTLLKDWYIDKNDIEAIIDSKGSIEDIWSTDFFKEFILNDLTLDYTESNSEYVKKSNIDKVLISKLFLAKVRSKPVKIDKETRTNTSALIERIRKKFKK
jgi:predicted ATP-dependent endonuclease of OLD family